MKKIGIVNSGGDTQAINAVIASIVKYGLSKDYKFVGFIKGWEGILDMECIDLGIEQIRGISHLGGTILHSVNKGRFAGKGGSEGDFNKIPDDILNLAKKNLETLKIDSLIVIGGDGTLSGALQLVDLGIDIVGVPKTIDNDLDLVDMTFGFSSAVEIGVEALDRVHTTAVSHDRVMFVETMGRHVGWIPLYAGLAGGADVILIPEIEFDYEGLIRYLAWRKKIGRNYSVVVVSEGAKAKNEKIATLENKEGRPEVRLGGISDQIMRRIEELAPGEFEMRNVVLGHTQRGGSPNAEDRILAKSYGVAAMDAVIHKKFGELVCYRNGKMETVKIEKAVEHLKKITKDNLVFDTAKKLGVYFGE
ncbi:MAG: ATP-dependent 6-phosphofructokinase [Candidatus Dojkabacteria bacterium]